MKDAQWWKFAQRVRVLEKEMDEGTLAHLHPACADMVDAMVSCWTGQLDGEPLRDVDGRLWVTEYQAAALVNEKPDTYQKRRCKGYGPRTYLNPLEQRHLVRLEDLALWFVVRRTFTESLRMEPG